MSTDMQNSTTFIQSIDAFFQLPTQNRHFIRNRQRFTMPGFHILLYLLKNPRRTDRSPAYHNGIYTVLFEFFTSDLRCRYITVSYDRYFHTRILFHLAYQTPIRLSGVHLTASTPMNRQCSNTAILQLLGQFYDYSGIMIPSEFSPSRGFLRHSQQPG